MSFCRPQLPRSSSTSYCQARWFNISLSVTIELSPTSECIFSLLFIAFLCRWLFRSLRCAVVFFFQEHETNVFSSTIDCLLHILKQVSKDSGNWACWVLARDNVFVLSALMTLPVHYLKAVTGFWCTNDKSLHFQLEVCPSQLQIFVQAWDGLSLLV